MRRELVVLATLMLAGCVAPAVRQVQPEPVIPPPVTYVPQPLRPLASAIAEASDLSQFRSLATAGGFDRLLAGRGAITVLAPTDAAFTRLPAGTVEALLQPGNRPSLLHLLRFWVLPGAAALATNRPRTLDDEAIAVIARPDATMLTDAAGRRGYVVGRKEATDGVLVELDGIIAPRSIEPGIPSPTRR